MRGSTIRDLEATTLSSSSSTDDGRVSNSYTLTILSHSYRGNNLLSLCYNDNHTTLIIKFGLVVYMYTYTTFQLFTDMAHTGHIQTIYNYSLPSWSRNQFSISVSVSVSAHYHTIIIIPLVRNGSTSSFGHNRIVEVSTKSQCTKQ